MTYLKGGHRGGLGRIYSPSWGRGERTNPGWRRELIVTGVAGTPRPEGNREEAAPQTRSKNCGRVLLGGSVVFSKRMQPLLDLVQYREDGGGGSKCPSFILIPPSDCCRSLSLPKLNWSQEGGPWCTPRGSDPEQCRVEQSGLGRQMENIQHIRVGPCQLYSLGLKCFPKCLNQFSSCWHLEREPVPPYC